MKFEGEYAFLSNMYSCPVKYDMEIFPCVETAFQFQKCVTVEDKEKFINDDGYWVNGFLARKFGRKVKLRSDWEEVKLIIMYELLEEKFYRNEKLREALKKTGNIEIVEDNDDTFWGVCNGKGQNMLGRMLMEIRENIIQADKKPMKVIVAGSRGFDNYNFLAKKLDKILQDVNPTIICGEARGADTLGKKYAELHSYKVMSFPADWSKGKGAGYIRNEQMAENADALVAFWDGKSKGTEHMIKTMKSMNKPVRVVKYETHRI